MDYNTRMADIMREWQMETGADAIDVDAASAWAIETGRYQRKPPSMQQLCKQDMKRALQHSRYTDPQGNVIRTMHAVRLPYHGEQLTFYIDIRVAKPDITQMSFDQNFQRIGNDVKRHSIEKHSYDINNPYGATLPAYDYDFNQHAEDARMSGEYDDTYEDDGDDELD
ncbi:MAG: hypothetical protein ICV60_01155 [Pyrinomonadaceae bacterium]|nr:hypothetical protein [Pyrinomonadaceae bacterium]